MRINIIKTQTYRSKPMVNLTDDMIIVTLKMKLNVWHSLRGFLKCAFAVKKGE
jgi:hypothetical protein